MGELREGKTNLKWKVGKAAWRRLCLQGWSLRANRKLGGWSSRSAEFTTNQTVPFAEKDSKGQGCAFSRPSLAYHLLRGVGGAWGGKEPNVVSPDHFLNAGSP